MADGIARRIAWAVEILDAQPEDRILKIGCMHGIAASQIAVGLTTGKIIAIDRSPKMLPAAIRRNEAHIGAGRVDILQAVPGNLDRATDLFDKILAIHIGLFRRPKPGELETIRNLLTPGGRLFIGMQPLHAEYVPSVTGEVLRNLEHVEFSVERVEIDDTEPVPCACVVARRV